MFLSLDHAHTKQCDGVISWCVHIAKWVVLLHPRRYMWQARWQEAGVPKKHLIDDPSTTPPGMDLPRGLWCLLNRFRTSAGPCRSSLHKWSLTVSPLCDCGAIQTMHYIVENCPMLRYSGVIGLHRADESALGDWAVLRLHSTIYIYIYIYIHISQTLAFCISSLW